MLSVKSLLAFIALATATSAQTMPKGYYQVVGLTSPGNDMTDISDLDSDSKTKWCNQRKRCVGYDNRGRTFKAFIPRSQWEAVAPGADKVDYILYIKNSARIAADSIEGGYEEYKGYAVIGNILTRVVNDLNDQKQWCNRRKKCFGFNSNGWMKKGPIPQKDWSYLGVDKSTFYRKSNLG
jgi:hypothetical protein